QARLHRQDLRRDLLGRRAREALQQILQRRVGLIVAVLGIVERNLGAGELARNVGGGLLIWRAVEGGAEALLQRRVLSFAIGVGTRELDRREHREALHRGAQTLLVRPRAISHDQRLVATSQRRLTRIVGGVVAGVPGYGGGRPVDQPGRRVERRPVNAQRRVAGI